jgi:hypothetical protein
MALIPAAIPSLWGLNLSSSQRTSLNHIHHGLDPLDRSRGECIGSVARQDPLTTSHRSGRAERWSLACRACRSLNLWIRDTPT